MSTLTGRARRFLGEEFGSEALTVEAAPGAVRAPAACLHLKGAVPGRLILQAGRGATRALLDRMTGGDYAPQEEAVLLGETLNEVLNILTGNITQDLADAGLEVQLSPPVAAGGDQPEPDPLSAGRLWSRCTLRTAAGEFLLAFLPPQPERAPVS